MSKQHFLTLISGLSFVVLYGVINEDFLPNYTSLSATGNTTTISAIGNITTTVSATGNTTTTISATGNAMETAETKNDTLSLLQSMTKCSLKMGIPLGRIKNGHILQVSQKADRLLRAMYTIIPKKFLKNYKNPCWYSNMSLSSRSRSQLKRLLENKPQLKKILSHHSSVNTLKLLAKEMVSSHKRTMYCLPYFYMAGFPKSGTTSLHQVFLQHPFIAMPGYKEPHWWARIPLGNMEEDYLRVATVMYLLSFSEANIKFNQVIYDGSTSTLWDSNFMIDHQEYCAMPALVSRVTPNAKFVVLMRDPASRLYSHFYFMCTLRFGQKMSKWPEEMRTDPAGHFHREVLSDIALFNQCLTNYSLYECTNFMRSHTGCGHVGVQLATSIYYVHLMKWMEFFPRKNFLLLQMQDMIAKPGKMMDRVSDFLKIPRMPEKSARTFNRIANKQRIVTDSVPTFLDMMPETRKILEEFYEPYNILLDRYL